MGGGWEMVASFRDFDVASALLRHRSARVRLVGAVYEDGRLVEQDIIAEVGSTREQP